MLMLVVVQGPSLAEIFDEFYRLHRRNLEFQPDIIGGTCVSLPTRLIGDFSLEYISKYCRQYRQESTLEADTIGRNSFFPPDNFSSEVLL